MEPDRRRKSDLDQGGEPNDDQSQKQDRKDRRAVTRILLRQVEPADLAGLPHGQKAGEQPAFAAARAAASKCRTQRRNERGIRCRQR